MIDKDSVNHPKESTQDPAQDHATSQRRVILNAALVAGSFLLAAAMGLIRNVIIARQFGLNADLDTFFAAFKLPDLLFTIVAGGALATAFIPVFAQYLADDDRDGAWRLTSAITNLVVLAVSLLAIVAFFFSPWLVRVVIAPGFDAAQQAETAAIMRIVLFSTLFFGISAVQSSALHGFQHFLTPALAPVFYPLGIIVGAIWLVPTWGVRGLAVGAVLGAILHLAVKIPVLFYFGFRWRPVLDLSSQNVRRVLVLMGPRVLDLGVFHLTLVASTNLASRLGEGSVGALEWGWEFMQLPETIIGTAFGLVVFPTLAQLAARQDVDGLRQTLSDSLQLLLALTIPAACGLILLGLPLIQLVYQGGAFDDAAGQAVNLALRYFALGLVGHVCLEVVARVFFAQQDTITPLLVAAGAAVLQISLALLLMGSLDSLGSWGVDLGHGGIALANSVAITVEVLVLLAILRRRLHGLQGAILIRATLRIVAAAAVMSGCVYGVVSYAHATGLSSFWTVVIGGGVGLVVYALAGLLLGVWRVADVTNLISSSK